MTEKIIVGIILASVLAGVSLAGKDAYQYAVAYVEGERELPSFLMKFTSEKASSSEVVSVSVPNSVELEATSSREMASSTTPVPTLPIVEVADSGTKAPPKIPTSGKIVVDGVIDRTWQSNSWGTEIVATSEPLTATFASPWAALSLYSTGFDLKDERSIEIGFAQIDRASSSLYIALYQGSSRLGAVSLAPYFVAGTNVAKIPLSDFELKANYVTDVVMESEYVGQIALNSMYFSPDVVVSKKVEAIGGATPEAPVVTPEVVVAIVEPQVYYAGMKNGWLLSGRRVVMDIKNEERSITGTAVKVSFETTTSAMSFYQPKGFDTKGYSYIRLRVYGGVTDYLWQQLYITLYDKEGKKLGTKDIAEFSGRGRILNQSWNDFEIPLRELGATDAMISTIDIENASVTQAGDAVWIDSIEFGSY